MITSFSKMLLPEPFTGSKDIESYITHFELLSHLQKWRRTETPEGNVVEIEELRIILHFVSKNQQLISNVR